MINLKCLLKKIKKVMMHKASVLIGFLRHFWFNMKILGIKLHAYNNKRQVFDCFTFFQELELLDLRFSEYYDCVDYFVIVEAKKTFTGNPHEPVFEKNKERFKEYSDKIIYVLLDTLPENTPDNIWVAESFQRNAILQGLQNKAKIGDIVLLSDIDEFWNKNKLSDLGRDFYPKVFEQNLYYYYVNLKSDIKWRGSCYAPYGLFKTMQDMRDFARFAVIDEKHIIENGGWHYSYQGGLKAINAKLKNLSDIHTVYDKIGSEEEIIKKVKSGKCLWDPDTEYQYIDYDKECDGPASISKFIKEYPTFYLQNKGR